MAFYFPPKIHILRYIKNENHMLGLRHKTNSYVIGMMSDKEAIYMTRILSENTAGLLDKFYPVNPGEDFDKERDSFVLHDNIKLQLTKENKPYFDWIIDTMTTDILLQYPREKYIGLILPFERTNETKDLIEYKSFVIEPIMDPFHFRVDI